jgi:hypothetical protein
MVPTTSKKSSHKSTTKKSTTKLSTKKPTATQKTTSQKKQKTPNTKTNASTSCRVYVEDEDDSEGSHIGEALSSDSDIIMEEVNEDDEDNIPELEEVFNEDDEDVEEDVETELGNTIISINFVQS